MNNAPLRYDISPERGSGRKDPLSGGQVANAFRNPPRLNISHCDIAVALKKVADTMNRFLTLGIAIFVGLTILPVVAEDRCNSLPGDAAN